MPTTVNPGRVRDFVRQFESDSMIEAALRVVERVRLIRRQDYADALRQFVEEHAGFHDGVLCALGDTRDSSNIATYYGLDVNRTGEFGLTAAPLERALLSKRPVIFLDDFIGSGNQAKTVVEGWLGEPLSTDLHEGRADPLPSQLQAAFRDAEIGFVFAAGWADGAAELDKRLKEFNLNAAVGVRLTQLPQAFDINLFESAEQEAQFKERCSQVGRALLSSGHSPEWVENRMLGYGNRAQLVVLPYNTPAQALTCLWASGHVGDTAWTPLFPRRSKTSPGPQPGATSDGTN